MVGGAAPIDPNVTRQELDGPDVRNWPLVRWASAFMSAFGSEADITLRSGPRQLMTQSGHCLPRRR
jgi:hypothetical protein